MKHTRRGKTLLAALLALALCVGLLPTVTWAAEGAEDITVEANPGMAWDNETVKIDSGGDWSGSESYDTSWYDEGPTGENEEYIISDAKDLAGLAYILSQSSYNGKNVTFIGETIK